MSELDIQTNPENRVEPLTSAPTDIPMEVRIEQYIKLRDIIKQADDAHKAKMAPARESLEKLNGIMLDHLNKIGGDSVRSKSGTVYRTTKRSASLEDPDAFMHFVTSTERFELIDRKANVKAVEDFAQENGILPPGVKMTSQQVVGVRKS